MGTDSVFQRVSYSKKDIERDSAQDVLADGAMVKLAIDKVTYKTAPTAGQGPGEDMIQMVRCSVIDPKDGVTRLKRHSVFVRNVLPLINPDYEATHIPPEYSKGLWSQFLQAFIPERHKPEPTRKDGQLYFDGKKVDPSQTATINTDRSDKRLKEAVDLSQNEGRDLLRRTAFATIKHSPSKDGSGGLFVNANDLRAALRPNEVLTAKEKLVAKYIPGTAPVAEGSNGKNGEATEAAPRRRRRP